MAGVELNLSANAPEQPPTGFAERAFAEYHLYDLGRKTTLRNNETKQIQFINLWDIPYTIEYLFAAETMRDFRPRRFGAKPMEESGSQPLKVVATVENKKANGLGIPLPAGTVRMYQEDREKTDRLIGEDRIDHTPKDEKVRLTVGRAFDVVGQRTVESANQINPKTFTQNIRVQIRNHKPEPIMVVVKETLMGHLNWTVEQTSEAYQKIDFQTIEYRFNLAGNTEKTIRYRVRYDQTQW